MSAVARTRFLWLLVCRSGASGAIMWRIDKTTFRTFAGVTYVLYLLAGSALFFAYALLAYATFTMYICPLVGVPILPVPLCTSTDALGIEMLAERRR
jgi:hypothetical protein